jgi:2-amino-4-hydroxy-6-hydroxymethyldihydropteridine diphosphokinase
MSDAPWRPAYVALGSNLDEPAFQVRAALAKLAGLPDTRLVARSRLWRTPPLGPREQPAFVNAVAGLLTRLTPEDLLACLQRIEHSLGKVPPPVRWGPRRIDLDLVAYAAERRDAPGFRLPHPGVPERAFVLYPLAEFAPALVIPGFGRVSDLVKRVSAEGLVPLEG